MENNFDLIIIGSGPGGYIAAIKASQLGMKVACIEKEKTLGGTCLNVGCIPSKALLESSELYSQAKEKFKDHGIVAETVSLDFKKFMDRKDGVVKQLTGGVAMLFKKNKIAHILGTGHINKDKSVTVKNGSDESQLTAKNIIIATGSVPISIPSIPFTADKIVDSTGALSLKSIPKTMVVIGGGYIGLEMGSVYGRLGSEITVIEALDRIVPAMDEEVGKTFTKILQKQGMKFMLSTKVKKASVKGTGVELELEDKDGKSSTLNTDVVLVAVGRKPNTDGLGLETVGVAKDDKGRVIVNDHYQTNVPGIYAIGDVITGPMLAHKASEEGVACVELIAGQAGHVNYNAIPSVVYTWPEVASVGLTEEQVKANGTPYKTFKFPFLAVGKAIAMAEKDGFVKLIANKDTDRILGAHIIGPRASDLIAELVLAMEYSASAEDIARTCHAHPTLAEGVKEAALGLGDGTLNM